MRVLLLAATALASHCAFASCVDDAGCSLNGVCVSSSCTCDAPWGGPSCSLLTFATTPAGAKDIYNSSDARNTWGGAIAGPDGHGVYHAYVPLYEAGSLYRVETTLHGIAAAPTGPWDFASRPAISSTTINPAFLAYPNSSSSSGTTYSLWTAGGLLAADSMDGPFTRVHGAGYAATNPAPVFFNGAFYATSQQTMTVVTAPSVHGPWTAFANISHPAALTFHVEDPFLWIDKRGHWHIINHAYDLTEYSNCGASHVSAHFFSVDGKEWQWSDQPYGHVVHYDDGSTHTFATLERPNLLFGAGGQPLALTVAVDLEASNGCANAKECCACCKFHDHAGTAVIALAAAATAA